MIQEMLRVMIKMIQMMMMMTVMMIVLMMRTGLEYNQEMELIAAMKKVMMGYLIYRKELEKIAVAMRMEVHRMNRNHHQCLSHQLLHHKDNSDKIQDNMVPMVEDVVVVVEGADIIIGDMILLQHRSRHLKKDR